MKDCFTQEMIKNVEIPVYSHNEELITGINCLKYRPTEIESNNTLIFLINNINELQMDDNNTLAVVSYFYCWFLNAVSPFTYGNETLASILINYVSIQKIFHQFFF